MAKPNIPSQRNAYSRLNQRLARYVALVEEVYDSLNLEAAKAATGAGYTGGKAFRWADYPQTKKKISDIQARFVDDLSAVIYRGTSEEWKNSNEAQDLIANKVLKAYNAQVHGEKYRTLYQENSDALKAFQERRDKGMNLSERLWEQSYGYKDELEAAISCAIQKGTSAITLSKQVSKYLLDFPSLQADYTEMYGHAADIHDCEYRSARLARTEINMAYRSAENERWKQMDFVVGMEIKTTQNGKHEEDICDTLAGRYPKDFVWTGWHPQCRCYKIPILKTEEEFWAEDETAASVNGVSDVPQNFKRWRRDNRTRIDRAESGEASMPYFIRDNIKTVDRCKLTIKERAEQRHKARTKEEIADIRRRAEERQKRLEEEQKRRAEEWRRKRLEERMRKKKQARRKEEESQSGAPQSKLKEVIGLLSGVQYREVGRLQGERTQRDIIERIGGGDLTKGSCSSLAFAYAGSRSGLDVLDFRDGKSREFFARWENVKKIAAAVGGRVERGFSDIKIAKLLLTDVQTGREYYFACGGHAAIVRKMDGEMQYLELQSTWRNGFHELDEHELRSRFGAKNSHTWNRKKNEVDGCIIDIRLLRETPC